MICSNCKNITEECAFSTFRTRKGEIRRRGICKCCRGKYAIENFKRLKEWRKAYNAKNKESRISRSSERRLEAKKIINKIKSKTPCFDCGKKFPPVAMDFDHCKGKNKGISSMVSQGYKIDLILEEIKLCQIVCACCHRIRTANRKDNQSPKERLLIVG